MTFTAEMNLAAGAISTHTPLARRDKFKIETSDVEDISTHTPLARRDAMKADKVEIDIHFYSHAPCEA